MHPATASDREAAILAIASAVRCTHSSVTRPALANSLPAVASAAVPGAIPASLGPIVTAAQRTINRAPQTADYEAIAELVAIACAAAPEWQPPPEGTPTWDSPGATWNPSATWPAP